MNPFNSMSPQIKSMAQRFFIEQNGAEKGSALGFFLQKSQPNHIQFIESAEIQNGDWLINEISGQRYFVEDSQPLIYSGSLAGWMVKYQTELQYQQTTQPVNNATFNIQTINGPSVIGSQTNVTQNVGNSLVDIAQLISQLPVTDQTEAKQLLEELEETEKSRHPVLVKGALAKFADFLENHPNLASSVGAWAVKLLIGQ